MEIAKRFIAEIKLFVWTKLKIKELPVSWKGTIAQYAGRLHRDHHSKSEVVIYDYADMNVPMLAKMYERRLRGYKAIGYEHEPFDVNNSTEEL